MKISIKKSSKATFAASAAADVLLSLEVPREITHNVGPGVGLVSNKDA